MKCSTTVVTILSVLLAASTASASPLISDIFDGIMGTTNDGGGTPSTATGVVAFQGGGTGANLIDGNSGTLKTNLLDHGLGREGWLGVSFDTQGYLVDEIQFDIAVFGDGGWFNGGEGVEPTVQVTTAPLATVQSWVHGFTDESTVYWTTIASTGDYPAGVNETTSGGLFTNHGVSNGDTFTFTFAPTYATAVRIIGDNGGLTAGNDDFIAAREIRVYGNLVPTPAPEPSTFVLTALAVLPLGLVRRRRQR